MNTFKTMSSKSFLSSVFMVLLLSTSAFSTASANPADVAAAEKRVINVTSRILTLLEQNRAQYTNNESALNAMVEREVLPMIDFVVMSKYSLGKHWRTASDVQQKRFISAFRQMLVNSYAKTMIKYGGAVVRAGNSVQDSKPGYVTVRTKVTPKGQSPIDAIYKVRKVGNDWKAWNFEIEGLNLLTNFRTNFTREVGAKGLDALITRLESSGK